MRLVLSANGKQAQHLGAVWFFFFCYHSSLNFHHSSLKIPQFPQPHPFGTHHSVTLFQKKKKKPKKSNIAAEISKVVGLITKMPLKTEFWKLKTPKMRF